MNLLQMKHQEVVPVIITGFSRLFIADRIRWILLIRLRGEFKKRYLRELEKANMSS